MNARREPSRGDKIGLMMRDGATCAICGEGPRQDDPLEVDHRIAIACGGSDDWINKRLVHRSCNRQKGSV